MICEQWFSTPIWYGKFNNIEDIHFKDAIQYCLQCKEDSPGRTRSNIGGWQSNLLFYNDLQNTPLAEFLKIINDYSKVAFLELGISPSPDLASIWININKKTDSNRLHNHPNSSLSGVFYLTQKNSAIVFKRDPGIPRHRLMWMNSNLNTLLLHTTVTYTPEQGNFFLFPSWLDHFVEPSQFDEERISVAFNYSYI